MQITTDMDLGQLAERMGAETTEAEARSMRRVLVAEGWGCTEEVPAIYWHMALDAAASRADAEANNTQPE